MRQFRPVFALLLLAAALFSWWMVETGPTTPTAAKPSGPREIDYHITGLNVLRMTEAGKPAHRLLASKVWHFTDDDTTELADPKLTVFQDNAPPWQIDSETAWLSADGSLLLLSGEVIIDRDGDAQNAPVHLVTSEVRVQPEQDYAETDEHVRVDSDGDWVESVGLQAWLRSPSKLKFLSQVKGYYVPR